MNERLLHFIWQFQYFNKHNLETTAGESLQVLHPGRLNTNQGPDFSAAKLRIGGTVWVGNIELHVNASDWFAHHHTADANYARIILHVVWNNDVIVPGNSGEPLPTLELQPLVPVIMLQHYTALMQANGPVPCASFLPVLENVAWLAWKERLVAERLQRKADQVLEQLHQAGKHWEEVCWWQLARNFGMKVNAALFEQVARSLPVTQLGKHKHQLHQLEAMLMGQAGLLNGSFTEDYPQLLQREYRFLAKKYTLEPVAKAPDFLRMRPANFPTIRLAQLAVLIQQSSHLFSKILETGSPVALRKLLDVTANDYWHYHYLFDEPTAYKPKKLGKLMAENVIINTIVPLLFAYGIYHQNNRYKEQAVQLLNQLPPEHNAITREWERYGVANEQALDAQALLELKQEYCCAKKCLHCAIGTRLLRQS